MSTSYNPNNETTANSETRCGADEEVRQAFAALPFEQKITTLFRVELDMLGDAINTVMAVASKAADKIVETVTGCEASDSEPANGGSTAL